MRRLTRCELSSGLKFIGFILSLFVAISAWALASPIGSDPDGNFHLASIWCGGGYKSGQCEEQEFDINGSPSQNVIVPRIISIANGCEPGNPAVSASCTNGLLEDQSFNETVFSNINNLYPKGFYWLFSHFVTEDIAVSVLLMRFVNSLILISLFLVGHFLLPRSISNGVSVSFLLTTLPLGLFLISSNNPSAWAIIGTGFAWAFLYGFLVAPNGNKPLLLALFATASTLLAAQSRADAAAFVILTGLASIFLAYSRHENLRGQVLRRCGLPLMLGLVAAYSFANTEQGNAVRTGFAEGNYGRDALVTTLWNFTKLPSLLAGIFGYSGGGGGLGWLDIAMPELVTLGMVAVLSAAVTISLSERNRIETLTLLFLLLAVVTIPIYILHSDRAIIGENFQSRYLLPLIVAVFGFIFSGSETLAIYQTKSFRNLMTFILPLIYLVAMHTTMRRYLTGNDVMDWNLNRDKEWWWENYPAPMTVLFAGTFSFAVVTRVVIRNLAGPR